MDDPPRARRRDAPPRTFDELTTELSETLRDLRDELDATAGPPLVPPPTPRGLLRFAEGQVIPTAVAVLEANIRALEATGAAIRLVDERLPGGTGAGGGRGSRRGAVGAPVTILDRLDDALGELQSALEGEPGNPEARRLLADARSLQREVRARLEEATGTDRSPRTGNRGGRRRRDRGGSGRRATGATAIDVTEADESPSRGAEPDDREGSVDVDGELDTIRDEVDRERRGEEDSAGR